MYFYVVTMPLKGELSESAEGLRYDMMLSCNGRDYEPSSFLHMDDGTWMFTFDGDGRLPKTDTLTAYLRIVGDESGTRAFPVELAMNG